MILETNCIKQPDRKSHLQVKQWQLPVTIHVLWLGNPILSKVHKGGHIQIWVSFVDNFNSCSISCHQFSCDLQILNYIIVVFLYTLSPYSCWWSADNQSEDVRKLSSCGVAALIMQVHMSSLDRSTGLAAQCTHLYNTKSGRLYPRLSHTQKPGNAEAIGTR